MRTFLKIYFLTAVLAAAPLIGIVLGAVWFYRARQRRKQENLKGRLAYALTREPPADSDQWDRRRAFLAL